MASWHLKPSVASEDHCLSFSCNFNNNKKVRPRIAATDKCLNSSWKQIINCFSARLAARCLTTKVSRVKLPLELVGWHSRQANNKVVQGRALVCVHMGETLNFARGVQPKPWKPDSHCYAQDLVRDFKSNPRIFHKEVSRGQFIQVGGSDSIFYLRKIQNEVAHYTYSPSFYPLEQRASNRKQVDFLTV